jgi:hypothetical protein
VTEWWDDGDHKKYHFKHDYEQHVLEFVLLDKFKDDIWIIPEKTLQPPEVYVAHIANNRAQERVDRMMSIMRKHNLSMLAPASFPVVTFDTPTP